MKLTPQSRELSDFKFDFISLGSDLSCGQIKKERKILRVAIYNQETLLKVFENILAI